MADYPPPHIHLSNKMDRNPLVLNPVTCITHLLHPHSQIPLLHQRESFLDRVVNYPTSLFHPHVQLPKPSLSTLHQPTLHHLESQIAVKVRTTTLVFQLKTGNLLVIARYNCTCMYSTLLTTHSNRIHATCTAIVSFYT